MTSLMRSAESFILNAPACAEQSQLTVVTTATLPAASPTIPPTAPQHGVLQLVTTDSTLRASLQQFIAAGFAGHYGARVSQFMPHLLGVSLNNEWQAALGVRFAAQQRLFTEQYLAMPAEQALARRGIFTTRQSLAEIGHLYAEQRSALMQLFVLMVQALHQLTIGHLLFAATADLKRLLRRHGIELTESAPADPACLGEQANAWGSYYATKPDVCLLSVAQAAARINADPRLQQLIYRHWPQLHALVDTLKETL